jgi:transcriptional antiterminator NusG
VIDDPSNPDDTREERAEARPEDVGAEDPSTEAIAADDVEPTPAEEVGPPDDEARPAPQAEEPAPEAEAEATASEATDPEATDPEAELSEEAPDGDLPEAEEPAPSPAVEAPPEDGKPDQDGEVAVEAEEAIATSGDPFSGPGDWYVIHTYAGYENKVRTNLESRINTMQMQDKIFDVVIPMEDVMEIKGGRKQVVQKKVFPGYLLVKMIYDDDSWYVVRNTPGVTGFVSSGTGQKPTPLSRREVEKILAVKKEEVKPAFRLDFEEGDVVRIISGPFADFNGTIDEINVDQSKVKVLVNIFDRETPVELSFDQVARV